MEFLSSARGDDAIGGMYPGAPAGAWYSLPASLSLAEESAGSELFASPPGDASALEPSPDLPPACA